MSEGAIIETHPPRRILRSIGALLAGMLVGIVLTIGTDIVLHVTGVFPPWGQSMVGFDGALLLATAYRTVFGVVGGYIIARLAPNRPMQHALVGGVVGLIVSIVGAAVTWNRGEEHRHSGLGLLTPAMVHYGQAENILLQRQAVQNL